MYKIRVLPTLKCCCLEDTVKDYEVLAIVSALQKMVVIYFSLVKSKGKNPLQWILIIHTMLLRPRLKSCKMLSNDIGPYILGQNHLLLKFCHMIP